jgi:carboxylesterase
MSTAVLPDAEAWSHVAQSSVGVLVLHGFTGNPGSMRELAQRFGEAGFHVELPRLAGHGTSVDDMLATRWADWAASAEAAFQTLSARCTQIVVAGLSMGGSLTLWIAGQHPEVKGLVCVNPATQPQPTEVIEMLQGMIDSGTATMPGIGSDIADPGVTESAYDSTPLACLVSMMVDGLAQIAPTYPSLHMPLLLLTSPQDHVVEPAQGDYLATNFGGPVQRVPLERSYHVATQDFDKGLIFTEAIAFVARVTA